jgi:hypothetical protein
MDMRQGPHKNRSRSRGRRPTNSAGRVYESNGPDVKVRGTAQHVADKYLQLARDAHSAGDTVMAEGYFQHAEHYLRILAAAQPFSQQNPQQRRPGGDDYSYEDGDEQGSDDEQPTTAAGNGETQRQPQPQPYQPQPQPQQQVQQQAQQPTASAVSEGAAGEQPWGGPEPEFLRRGPPSSNGSGSSGRARRTRQPRAGNGRNETPPSAEGNDDASPVAEDSSEPTN